MRSATLLVVATLSAFLTAKGQNPPGDSLDRAIQAELANGFSGAVLIARADTILLDKAYGAEAGVAMQRSSRFWIASAAKQFTSAAIMRCKENGWLTLDDSLARFFPNAPADKRRITLRQLLTHTSGIGQSYVSEETTSRDTAVQRMLAEPLATPPGERFGYANNNYQLAVAVVEVASGKQYADFVREELWQPVGLTATGFAGETGTAPVPARNPVPDRLNHTYWGGEGVFSTTRDLFVWYRSLRGGRILARANADTLFAPVVPIQEGATGLGWFVGTTSRGASRLFTRGNEGFGANSLVYAYPQSGVVIIILSHADATSDGQSWSRAILTKLESLMSL